MTDPKLAQILRHTQELTSQFHEVNTRLSKTWLELERARETLKNIIMQYDEWRVGNALVKSARRASSATCCFNGDSESPSPCEGAQNDTLFYMFFCLQSPITLHPRQREQKHLSHESSLGPKFSRSRVCRAQCGNQALGRHVLHLLWAQRPSGGHGQWF